MILDRRRNSLGLVIVGGVMVYVVQILGNWRRQFSVFSVKQKCQLGVRSCWRFEEREMLRGTQGEGVIGCLKEM